MNAQLPMHIVVPEDEADAHSPLGASSIADWVACPARLYTQAKSKSSEPAAEGTLGHYIGERELRDGFPYPPAGSTGQVGEFRFDIDADFIRDVDAYVRYVRSRPWVGRYSIESRVNYSAALGVPYNMAYGTADAMGFVDYPHGRTLEVIDLKMGRVYVEAINNPQMTAYAAGVIGSFDSTIALPDSTPVRLTIAQPRLSHVPRSWDTTVGAVRQRMFEWRPAAKAAVEYAQLNPSEQTRAAFPEAVGPQCKYCPRAAALECQAIKDYVVNAARLPKGTWDPHLYRACGALTTVIENMEAWAVEQLTRGVSLPGVKLVKGNSGRPFVAVPLPKLREIAMQYQCLPALAQVEEVWLTPAKIRDTLKAVGVPIEVVKQVIQAPPAKPVLTTADDSRPAWQPGELSAFTGVARP